MHKTRSRSLSAKEKAFCREYINLKNAERAAITAGYSPKTARKDAAGWLTGKRAKTGVVAEIARLEEKLEKKALMDAQETEELLDIICRANIFDYYNEAGIPKSIKDLTPEQTYALKDMTTFIKESTNGKSLLAGTSIELHDKLKALQMKMKRLGMLKDGTDKMADTFEQWLDRVHAAAQAGKDK